MKERLQVYYDPEVDVQVNELIETFDRNGKGKRGYKTDKIKECLKVYQLLAERCGTSEPMDVLLHYIDGLEPKGATRDKNRVLGRGASTGATRDSDSFVTRKERAEEKEVSDEVDAGVVGLVSDDGGFEFDID